MGKQALFPLCLIAASAVLGVPQAKDALSVSLHMVLHLLLCDDPWRKVGGLLAYTRLGL